MQNEKFVPPEQEPPPYSYTSAPAQAAYTTVKVYPPLPTAPQPPPSYAEQAQPTTSFATQQPYVPGAQAQPAVVVVAAEPWYINAKRNKPQSNAVAAASLIFISGGMNIAWSAGFRSSWTHSSDQMGVCWFVGGVIGALIGSILANKLPKKYVFQFCSLLVLIDGIVFASVEYNPQATTAALYLDGIANGLTFVPALALVGEVSVRYKRGLISTSIEQMSYGLGFFLQIIYVTCWAPNFDGNFSVDQLHGILSAVYGFIALILSTCLTIESPVIMLANGQEQQAIDALRRLQRPYTVTRQTYEQLADHKRYLELNKDLSVMQSITQAFPAYLRICYLRALNAMTMSSFMAMAFVNPKKYLYFEYVWPLVVYTCFRWFGSFFTVFSMESGGRKKPTLLGLLFCSGLAFAIGAEFSVYVSTDAYTVSVVFWLICVFQLFAAIAFTPTSAYISEAYPLGVKQHFIGATFIAEMLVYIIIQVCDFSFTGCSTFFYTFGGLSIFAFLVGIFCLPETKLTPLRVAQEKFRGFVSKGF